MSSTSVVWKQYNKMAVLHFILVNSTLIYIPFFLVISYPGITRVPAFWCEVCLLIVKRTDCQPSFK